MERCSAAMLLLTLAAGLAGASDPRFHTSPACWDAPRIYHAGPPPAELANRLHLIDVPADAPAPGEPTPSPNGGYAFWVRNPDTGQTGPWSAGLIVDNERSRRPTLLIEAVAQPIAPRWINEKLIYVRVVWGRTTFSDLILDVERAELVYHEQAVYGDAAFAQFQDSCDGACPCPAEGDSDPADDPGHPDMPTAIPGPDAMIGLLTLPSIFGPGESGGPVAALDPRPVAVYDAPEAGARKLGEPAAPEDFEAREYAYESPAAVVYQRRPGWYQIALVDGRRVWMAERSAGQFLAIGRLLVDRLSYLNYHWDGYVWKSPTRYLRSAQSPLRRATSPRGREAYPVRVLDARDVGDGLWLQIETLDRDPCDGDPVRVVDRGWIPAYSSHGALVAGFYSRGC